MPRAIAAGMLGIARTIEAFAGSADWRNASVRPAMTETTSVAGPTRRAISLSASGAICGFTATTIVLAIPIVSRAGLRRTPSFARAATATEGCGSTTTIRRGSRPRLSQFSSSAPPILPAPMRTSGPEISESEPAAWTDACGDDVMAIPLLTTAGRQEVINTGRAGLSTLRSRLAGGLKHCSVERLAGALAGPEHELERLIVAFAGFERSGEQGFALRPRWGDATCQNQRVAVHRKTVLEPEIKMPDPKLFVHPGDELHGLRPAPVRDAQI